MNKKAMMQRSSKCKWKRNNDDVKILTYEYGD